MQYKDPDCQVQLMQSAAKLQEIAFFFEDLSKAYGVEAVVTRVWDAVCGDSGVHEARRAIDFRDETRPDENDSVWLYTPEQAAFIANSINEKYPRGDGKPTCLHHSFNGAPFHFHCQIPSDWA